MKITDPGYHLKLIEMCDCYLETDFVANIEQMVAKPGADLDEETIKYLALAILYTLTEKAKKLIIKQEDDEITVKIKGEDGKIAVKAPSPEIFKRITEIMRGILHLEADEGEIPLSLGLKNVKLDVRVKMIRKVGKEKVVFVMPPLM